MKINGIETELFYYENPMSHEDWHKVEESNLVYCKYSHGLDYWDDQLIFCHKEDEERVNRYFDSFLPD